MGGFVLALFHRLETTESWRSRLQDWIPLLSKHTKVITNY